MVGVTAGVGEAVIVGIAVSVGSWAGEGGIDAGAQLSIKRANRRNTMKCLDMVTPFSDEV